MIRLSFRQKLLLTYAACAFALIFVAIIGVSLYINALQKSNVHEATLLAEEQAGKMAEAITGIMLAHSATDLNDPQVEAGIRAYTRVNLTLNKSILWAAVISPDGERYIEEIGDRGRQYYLQRDGEQGSVSEFDLPGGMDLRMEVVASPEETTDISVPIEMAGNKQGQIKLRIEQSSILQNIEASSQRITRALVFGCIMMLLFMLGIFYILWRMFFSHLELQEKTARLDRMAYVGTLASGLAHEIRNPLSAMNVNLEVIREDLADLDSSVADRTGELSRRVQDEVARLNGTLTNFLDFALPRKEGYSQFPVRGLVQDLVDTHAEQLKTQGISVEIDGLAMNNSVVEADRHLLHQALRNVFLNAMQILEGSVKKSIRINISAMPGDILQIAVSDTGPGISQENMSEIFNVFYSTRQGGSGFGLAIARKILEEHHGRLWAENNTDSLGATFTMELPRFAPNVESKSESKRLHSASTWMLRSRETKS